MAISAKRIYKITGLPGGLRLLDFFADSKRGLWLPGGQSRAVRRSSSADWNLAGYHFASVQLIDGMENDQGTLGEALVDATAKAS
jgi:hypothetical protein